MTFIVAPCAWENCTGLLYIVDGDDEQEVLCMKCGNATVFNPEPDDDEDDWE